MITDLATVKTVLGITDTTQDALIALYIPLVEESYLDIRNIPFKLDTDGTTIIYPDGANVTASLMVGFKLGQKADGRTLSSESIDSYSASWEKIDGKYPKSVTADIKQYINGV